MKKNKKEYGSDFHICLNEELTGHAESSIFLNNNKFSLFFSGRVALYSLLEQGIKEWGWETVFFPGYYCHEVVEYIKNLPIKVLYYEFNPFLDSVDKQVDIEDNKKNVIINVLFFGLCKLDLHAYREAVIIDDTTHDILSDYDGDFVFGSLRKQLPLPCGGFVGSLKNKIPKPYPSNSFVSRLAFKKLAGMVLKNEYLSNNMCDKSVYRQLFIDAEADFSNPQTNCELPSVARTILKDLNVTEIIHLKEKNLNFALSSLRKIDGVQYNLGSVDTHHGLGLILYVKNPDIRDRLRSFLISKSIYPAILWPGQLTERNLEVQKCVLFLSVDYRYNIDEIRYIVDLLNNFFDL